MLKKNKIAGIVLAFEDRLIKVYDKEKLVVVGIYFKVNDNILEKIKNKQIDFQTASGFNIALKQTGDNVHFFACASESMKHILKGIKMVREKENPKSISWFSPKQQFFIRRLLCQFQQS